MGVLREGLEPPNLITPFLGGTDVIKKTPGQEVSMWAREGSNLRTSRM